MQLLYPYSQVSTLENLKAAVRAELKKEVEPIVRGPDGNPVRISQVVDRKNTLFREIATSPVVLDPLDIESGPSGAVRMPRRVPHGFHATWVPA